MRVALTKEKLVEKLVEAGKLKSESSQRILLECQKQKKSLFQALAINTHLSEEEILDFFSEQLRIPELPLQNIRVDKDIIKLVPKKIVDRYQIIPLSKIQKLMTVATSDPFEIMLGDDLKELTGCEIVFVLATQKAIQSAIDRHYLESDNLQSVVDTIDDENLELIKSHDRDDSAADIKKLRSSVEDAPVVRFVNLILDEALKSRASDIHFEPYYNNFRIRYRIDGALKESFSDAKDLYNSLVARIKIISQLNITEKRLPQDGRFKIKLNNQREVDFRVSILPTYHGEKIVLRILDRGGLKSGLNQLGFSEKPTSVFAEAVRHPYGAILVTGPTGSGKSTTLYTILNTMNTLDRNIMTIEDPVEYQIEGITQTQVNAEVGLTFASGLRSLLRQSPDIVLVGEIRDTETADIAIKAALTGHLVFSTLHTNSASGAMTRLIDMGVEPFLIASSVICVAAQRLMKKICPNCKAETEVTEDQLRRSKLKKSDFEGFKAYKGKGCVKCNQTGYFGRVATVEVLKIDSQIREMIVQRKPSGMIEEVAIKKGMETLFINAFNIFKNGITTLEEVLRVSAKE